MTQMKLVRRRATEQQVEREVVVVDDGQGVLLVAPAHPAAPVTRHQMRGHPHPHHPDHRGGPPPRSETQGCHLVKVCLITVSLKVFTRAEREREKEV